LPEPPSQSAGTEAELVETLDRLLEDAVRRQLIADVPVGILLSGGIDSSLVTAMAARVSSQPVRTFTIAFPGHGAFDESPFARLVAEHFGTEHTELVAEPASANLLPQLARQYDEPMADSSMVPTYLVSRLIRQHATVALGGDGGDELFGGYVHYRWILQQERVRRLVPRPVRRLVRRTVLDVVPTGVKGRNYALGYASDLGESIARYGLFFDLRGRRRIVAASYSGAVNDTPETAKGSAFAEWSPLQRATAVDFSSYLPDDILVKVDRASMLTSLEVRAPFLDHRIIEFAFGRVPDHLKATITERKILPRRLAKRLLPPALDLRRKQGFSIPLQKWFKGEWGRMFESVLSDADPTIFDRRAVEQLLDAQRRGLANTNRLFALTLFELWRREYGVTA
jgi:asparagine synthase (glutamine-hydrolysing)